VIDTATNKLARWINLPDKVYSSTPTQDGKLLIANAPSGKLFVIDLSTEKVISEYLIPPRRSGKSRWTLPATTPTSPARKKGTIEFLDLRGGKLESPLVLTPGVDGIEWFPAIS